jgi:hypothetical protein
LPELQSATLQSKGQIHPLGGPHNAGQAAIENLFSGSDGHELTGRTTPFQLWLHPVCRRQAAKMPWRENKQSSRPKPGMLTAGCRHVFLSDHSVHPFYLQTILAT